MIRIMLGHTREEKNKKDATWEKFIIRHKRKFITIDCKDCGDIKKQPTMMSFWIAGMTRKRLEVK